MTERTPNEQTLTKNGTNVRSDPTITTGKGLKHEIGYQLSTKELGDRLQDIYDEMDEDIMISSEDLYGDHSFDCSSRLSVRNVNYENA